MGSNEQGNAYTIFAHLKTSYSAFRVKTNAKTLSSTDDTRSNATNKAFFCSTEMQPRAWIHDSRSTLPRDYRVGQRWIATTITLRFYIGTNGFYIGTSNVIYWMNPFSPLLFSTFRLQNSLLNQSEKSNRNSVQKLSSKIMLQVIGNAPHSYRLVLHSRLVWN